MFAARPRSWLDRAKKGLTSIAPLIGQEPQARDLQEAQEAFYTAEHEFEQAAALRRSSRQGARAEAAMAHRAGKAAFQRGEAAWEAHKRAHGGTAACMQRLGA